MGLTIVRHPVLADRLTRLRDERTAPAAFRQALADAALVLAVHATQDLPTIALTARTPLGPFEGRRIADEGIVLVPVLRAGLGMVEAVHTLFPQASVHHVGVYRNEETRDPVPYYVRDPGDLKGRLVLILDPMLATGGSATFAAKLLAASGASDIRLLCVVAAPPGVEKLRREAPDVRIYTLALDERLNDDAFIVPGLGDAGDRQFGAPEPAPR